MTQSSFFGIKAEDFPLVIEFYSVASREFLHSITVDSPGAIQIPGQEFFKEPVSVRIVTGTGRVEETFP